MINSATTSTTVKAPGQQRRIYWLSITLPVNTTAINSVGITEAVVLKK